MLVTTMTGASFLTTIMYTFREFDTGQFYTMLPHIMSLSSLCDMIASNSCYNTAALAYQVHTELECSDGAACQGLGSPHLSWCSDAPRVMALLTCHVSALTSTRYE